VNAVLRAGLASCAVLLAAGAGRGGEPVLVGDVLTMAAPPEGTAYAQIDPLATRPDWDPQVLASAAYAEYAELDGSRLGVVTCETRGSTYASLATYEPAGTCTVRHVELPLPPDHVTMMTFEFIPDAVDGQTRLLLWGNPPQPGLLRAALLEVQTPSSVLPGLLAERWFARSAPGGGAPPWEDNVRGTPDAPQGYPPGSTPLLMAVLSPRNEVEAKDCAVLTMGGKTIAFDDYGAYGCWSLAFGGELHLVFEMPSWPLPRRAQLVIDGADGLPLSWPGLQQLEVNVNGWTITDSSLVPAVQHSPLSVSQYLRGGDNRISLRLQSFSGKTWLIRGIQVWSQ
jgi:hypothetical protein